MPHTASAWKRLRKAEKRRRQNKLAAKQIKAQRKEVATALAGSDAAKAASEFKNAQAVLDRAASKGYIHKNKAARIKSRLVKRMRAANGQVVPKRHDPQRKWKSVMSKFTNRRSAAQVAALDREDAVLDARFPGEYVAYVDTWSGDELTRQTVAHAPDSASFQARLAALDAVTRERMKLTRIPDADALSVPSVQFT